MLSEIIPRASVILRSSRRLRSDRNPRGSFNRSKPNNSENKEPKEEFSKLIIWGGNADRQFLRTRRIVEKTQYYPPPLPKAWTKVWPSAHSSSNILPLPIRQGHVKNSDENSGLIPDRFANTELMKIPNFLHLTPEHIKKHCAALKPFLTEWPTGLKSDEDVRKHYPIEVISREFVFSSPSMRDDRSRHVTLRVPTSLLRLDLRQLDKFRALAGPDRLERSENGEEVLVLSSERCPTRKQNYDFLRYVLTALTAESKKVHAWEKEQTEADWNIFRWEGSSSEKALRQLNKNLDDTGAVERYKKAVIDLRNSKEALPRVEEYKDSVKQLLGLQKASS